MPDMPQIGNSNFVVPRIGNLAYDNKEEQEVIDHGSRIVNSLAMGTGTLWSIRSGAMTTGYRDNHFGGVLKIILIYLNLRHVEWRVQLSHS